MASLNYITFNRNIFDWKNKRLNERIDILKHKQIGINNN